MKTRKTTWFNVKTEKEVYGIEVNHPVHGWIHAGDIGGMFKFERLEDRDEKISELESVESEILNN